MLRVLLILLLCVAIASQAPTAKGQGKTTTITPRPTQDPNVECPSGYEYVPPGYVVPAGTPTKKGKRKGKKGSTARPGARSRSKRQVPADLCAILGTMRWG